MLVPLSALQLPGFSGANGKSPVQTEEAAQHDCYGNGNFCLLAGTERPFTSKAHFLSFQVCFLSFISLASLQDFPTFSHLVQLAALVFYTHTRIPYHTMAHKLNGSSTGASPRDRALSQERIEDNVGPGDDDAVVRRLCCSRYCTLLTTSRLVKLASCGTS